MQTISISFGSFLLSKISLTTPPIRYDSIFVFSITFFNASKSLKDYKPTKKGGILRKRG